jgi:hypothetical protein
MVTERLLLLELNTAVIAMINIDRHDCFSLTEIFLLLNLAGHYSVPKGEKQGQPERTAILNMNKTGYI